MDVPVRLLFGISFLASIKTGGRGGGAAGARAARVVRERVCLRRPLSYQYAIAATRVSHRWGWFIWAHKQPNNFGVAMHACTSIWIAMGALLRVFGERNRPPREAGACYVFAAYAFFGGQMGLTLTAEASHVDVGAYVVIWHILPCCWLRVRPLFLARRRRRYGAVATLDDEAPGIIRTTDPRPGSIRPILI